jgi:hypothetical protein
VRLFCLYCALLHHSIVRLLLYYYHQAIIIVFIGCAIALSVCASVPCVSVCVCLLLCNVALSVIVRRPLYCCLWCVRLWLCYCIVLRASVLVCYCRCGTPVELIALLW